MRHDLKEYRQVCAQELGPFASGAATAGSSVAFLEARVAPFLSSIDVSQTYRDWYLYRPKASLANDMSRIVSSYDPSNGYFTPDSPYASAPIVNEAFELHGLIEPQVLLTGMINDALKMCFTTTEVTFTPTQFNTRQNLSFFFSAWLTDARWIRKAGFLLANELRDRVNPYLTHPLRGEVSQSGETIYLNHGFTTFNGTETIYLEVDQPASAACLTVSQAPTTVLRNEDDTCSVDPLWVASATLVEAWRRVGHLLEPVANQKLIRDRTEAAIWFNALTRRNWDPPPLRLQPMRVWGPPR